MVYSLTALYIVSMTIFGGITAVLCWKIHTLKQKGNPLIILYSAHVFTIVNCLELSTKYILFH